MLTKDNTNALNIQVAGNHYKTQKIQPIELTYILGQTAAFCKVCKYTTRVKDNPLQQVDKAIHCIQLEETLVDHMCKYSPLSWEMSASYIKDFTEDTDLREALKCMVNKNYKGAISALNKLRSKLL